MTHTKKVSVYARSGHIAPSGYYRILQYLNRMDKVDLKIRALLSDIQFKYYIQVDKENIFIKLVVELITYVIIISRVTCYLICDVFRKPEFIVLSRVFVPRYMPFYFRPLIKRILKYSALIWDFDDHILNSRQISESTFLFFCEISTKILVIHEYLKSIIPEEYWNKVIMLPTTDGDMQKLTDRNTSDKIRKKLFEKEIRLIWVATSGNLVHMDKIMPILDETAKNVQKIYQKKLILTIVCNLPLIYKAEYLEIRNIVWTKYVAIQEMINSHIGIMPLLDTIFAKGKGGFKLIQYLAIGLPILASDVGFNKEIVNENCGYLLSDNDTTEMWQTNILNMTKTWDILSNLSNGAYEHWENRFSYNNNYKIWENILAFKE